MLKGQDRSRFGQGRSDLDWSWLNLDRSWPKLKRTCPNFDRSCPNVEGSRFGQDWSNLDQTLTDQSLVNKVCNQKFVRFVFRLSIFESYVNRVEFPNFQNFTKACHYYACKFGIRPPLRTTGWQANQQTDLLDNWLVGNLACRLAKLAGRPTSWQAGQLAGRQANWLVGRPTGWQADKLAGR